MITEQAKPWSIANHSWYAMEPTKMARGPTMSYLVLAIVGLGLTAWLGHKIVLAEATLANPHPVVALLGLLACVILCATGLFIGMAFLFSRRFVAEVRHDGTTFTLVSASGQALASAENVRIIRRLGNPYEFPTPRNDRVGG